MDERLPHRATRDAHNVTGHGAQLDVRVFQHLVHPVHDAGLIANQGRAVPRQIAQLPNGGGRNEAAFQEPMLQQLRNPLGIADVGFPPGDLFHVARIDQQDGEPIFEQVPDRFPKYACRFHRDVRHPRLCQPVRQRQQIGGHRGRTSNDFVEVAVRPEDATTYHHEGFVHIQACAAGIDHLHRLTPFRRHGQDSRMWVNLFRVLPWGDTVSGSRDRPGQTVVRARSATEGRPRIPVRQFHSIPPSGLFIVSGRRRYRRHD